MSRQRCRFVAVFICSCLVALSAALASSEIPPELVGTWDCASFQAIKNGKPFGKIVFKPGQWTLILNADGTYLEKLPLKAQLPSGDSHDAAGTYEVHKHDLKMKPANRGRDLKYDFKVEQDGKVLVLTDKNNGTILNANRE